VNSTVLILLILLLIIDVIVTAARAGLLNIRHARLLSLSVQQEASSDRMLELISSRTSLRASLKFTQNLLRFLISGVVLNMFSPWNTVDFPTAAFGGILILLAVLIWIIETIVERVVLRNPEVWAIRFTPLAHTLMRLLSPLLAIPSRVTGPAIADSGLLVTVNEEELKSLVDASKQAGVIESDESQMIHSIFDFGDTLAREIMVPRIDMVTLEVNTPLEEAADVVLESGFSRVPVYQDQIDNILGILYTKDMLKVWRDGNHADTLRRLLRTANFIPEAKKVDDLLGEMQKERTHIAIVVDEYGGVAGLVTLEDIVEEIFGEIQDEYDEGEELPHQIISEGEHLFLGRIELDEFNEIMGSQLQGNGADTLGGLIYSRLGRVPEIGEILVDGDLQLTVEQVERHRILKVRVRIDQSPSETNPDNQQE
jgi:CBS domain containing-hemolysin-like protein